MRNYVGPWWGPEMVVIDQVRAPVGIEALKPQRSCRDALSAVCPNPLAVPVGATVLPRAMFAAERWGQLLPQGQLDQ